MPSFDIVSEVNIVELRHAVDNSKRELATRFDFQNTIAHIELKDLVVSLQAQSDFQVRQLEDLFRNQCSKRGLNTSSTQIEDKPIHSGKTYNLSLTFKQGIDQDDAREITKLIKLAKLKVQSSIQGDKIRVNAKNRDELQECIAYLKKSELELALQFNNFRD